MSKIAHGLLENIFYSREYEIVRKSTIIVSCVLQRQPLHILRKPEEFFEARRDYKVRLVKIDLKIIDKCDGRYPYVRNALGFARLLRYEDLADHADREFITTEIGL